VNSVPHNDGTMDQIELSLLDCRLFCLLARETIIQYMYIKSVRSLINRDQQSQASDSEFICHRARSDLRSSQSQYLLVLAFCGDCPSAMEM
jgi:hypothetical protein